MIGPIDHLIFVVLVLVLPIRAAANFRKMARAPDADVPRVRLRAYRLIIVGQWVLALGVIALWIALRPGFIPERHAGEKIHANGYLLINDKGIGLSVTWLESIGPNCTN